MQNEVRTILQKLQNGECSIEEAERALKAAPFADLGFANVDLHRALRQGTAEVIYGAGKTAAQIVGILHAMTDAGQGRVIVTRLSPDKAAAIRETFSIDYDETAQFALLGGEAEPDGLGTILVVTGGTSDIPVAREALLTARALGNRTEAIFDVGVAGLHRLLSRLETIQQASVIVAVAGMEGALASVVGGLVDCPVIAVPTSVGYGASFGGVSALLSMLNSCASGVSVVNIDNGFGAGFLASRINHMEAKG